MRSKTPDFALKGYENSGSCYNRKGNLSQSDTTKVQIYHRIQSRQPDDVETARMQIASQELWGGPSRGFFQSDIPKVKAYLNKLPQGKDGMPTASGIEFTTTVEPDRCTRPGLLYWSGAREGVRNEDGYAKIKVRIEFCNQFDEVYIADE